MHLCIYLISFFFLITHIPVAREIVGSWVNRMLALVRNVSFSYWIAKESFQDLCQSFEYLMTFSKGSSCFPCLLLITIN